MQKLLALIVIVSSFNAFADRQYIQCRLADSPESTMGIIINLDKEYNDNTLYITNGFMSVAEIDVVWKDLKLKKETATQVIYKTGKTKLPSRGILVETSEVITIDKKDLGVASNFLEIIMDQKNIKTKKKSKIRLSCFSSMNEA